MTYQYPIAEAISVRREGHDQQTVLTLDRVPSSPIAPASLYSRDDAEAKILDLHALVLEVPVRTELFQV